MWNNIQSDKRRVDMMEVHIQLVQILVLLLIKMIIIHDFSYSLLYIGKNIIKT